jgi:hypothetical protein
MVKSACLAVLVVGLMAPAVQERTPSRAPSSPAAATQPGSRIVDRLLSGAAPRAGDEVIATYDHAALSRDDFLAFLLETRGLDALLNLMQLRIASALAEKEGVRVTAADVEAETHETLRQAFGQVEDLGEDQYGELLTQLLMQQQLSRTEFDVVMATNAHLKALARPRVAEMLNEENLRKAFNIRYGEQVRVRHIQLETLAQVAEVKRRLEGGEDFAKVAGEVSRNADTRRMGGLFPPFSMQSDIPVPFKQAAFDLSPGQMSDPVEAGGFYHLIKLEERVPPQAVEFEKVREELRKVVAEEQSLLMTSQLRRLIAQMLASENLRIEDPALAEQWRTRIQSLRPQPMGPQDMKSEPATQALPASGEKAQPRGTGE